MSIFIYFSKALIAAALVGAVLSPASAMAQPNRAPIIDSHAHIRLADNDFSGSPDHPRGSAALTALAKELGFSRVGLVVIAGGGPEATRQRNDALLAQVAAAPDLFFPIASVHPADGVAALAELDRLHAKGVRQVKLHPNSQEFDVSDAAVAAVTDKAGALGMSVLIDCFNPFDPGQFGKIMGLALRQPKTNFILAHMNYVDFRQTATIGLLRQKGAGQNIYFDLSIIATTYVDSPMRAELLWTVRHIGADRFLFGSDWPNDDPRTALRAIRRIGLTPAELRLILHDNAARLGGG